MTVSVGLRAAAWPMRWKPAGAMLLIAAGLTLTAQAGPLLFVGEGGGTQSLKTFDGTSGAFIYQDSISGSLGFPTGIAVGPDGNVYLGDNQAGAIDRFNGSTGAFIDQVVPAGSGADPLVAPSGLAFGPNGNLYVADYGTGGAGFINVYTGMGAFVTQLVAPNTGPPFGLDYPAGIAVGSNGDVYVADSASGIDLFGPTGNFLSVLVPLGSGPGLSGLSNPSGVTFGPDGNLYVADEGTGDVAVYNSTTGHFLGVFGDTGSLAQPIGLGFGPNGNLYVTDSLGVEEFNGTTGASLGTFIAGGSGNLISGQYLAFSNEVPEPAPFSLAALAGILGFCWRRRTALTSRRSPG